MAPRLPAGLPGFGAPLRLTVLNFSLLVLVFALGRNLVRRLMEWRRRVFGARLRVQQQLVFR